MGSTLKNFAAGHKLALAKDASDEPLLKPVASAARQPDPAGVRFISSKGKAATAFKRRQILERFAQLKKLHGTITAARMVRRSIPTLWRWKLAFKRHGLAGLQTKLSNCGRRSPFRSVQLTAQAARRLESMVAQHGSRRAAWQVFAGTADCPELIAYEVQHAGRPPAAFAQIGRLTPVQARVFLSSDGCRLFVRLPGRGTVAVQLGRPA